MRPRPTPAAWVVIAVMAAGLAGAGLALAGAATPARAPLVLLFLAVAPAVTVAGLLRRFEPLARIVIAVTSTIALNVLVAETMLQTGTWSPTGGLIAMIVIVAAGLVIQAGPVRTRVNRRLSSWRAAVARWAAPPAGESQIPPPGEWRLRTALPGRRNRTAPH